MGDTALAMFSVSGYAVWWCAPDAVAKQHDPYLSKGDWSKEPCTYKTPSFFPSKLPPVDWLIPQKAVWVWQISPLNKCKHLCQIPLGRTGRTPAPIIVWGDADNGHSPRCTLGVHHGCEETCVWFHTAIHRSDHLGQGQCHKTPELTDSHCGFTLTYKKHFISFLVKIIGIVNWVAFYVLFKSIDRLQSVNG